MSDSEKATLIAEIEAARAKIAVAAGGLQEAGKEVRRTFDIPGRAKESFENHRPAWLGGAAILGLLLSKLPARNKTVFVEQATGRPVNAGGKLAMLWSAVKLAGGLAKPFLGDLAAQWVATRVEKAKRDSPQPKV